MGIPCYFSNIIRKYDKIMFKKDDYKFVVNNFYLDSNSIIYDAIRKCDITRPNFAKQIQDEVIFQLEQHIIDVDPTHKIIIAFDGIAPMAKIQQQRERRFKSDLERKIRSELYAKEESWDTCNITPGTTFMRELMFHLENYFTKYDNVEIYSSNNPGEGEHKIFEYIRKHPAQHTNMNTVIYGLDADLIMLCISHKEYCKNLYLYRETPHFIRSIAPSLEPNSTYLLDISNLIKYIQQDVNKMLNDYVFVCFLLGNDFLPHFPALNIRTTGMATILATYKLVFKSGDNNLVSSEKNIIWKNLRLFISELAKQEHDILCDEYWVRDKWERRVKPCKTNDDKMEKFNNIPTKNRDIENMIDPFSRGWRERYYTNLLDINPTVENIKRLCINYLEGLEWTYRYYTDSCYDWRWKYKYSYPPLLEDLARHVPYFDISMIQKREPEPLDPRVQLSFVLPIKSFDSLVDLDDNTREKVKSLLYYDDVRYEWSFCKYFWEAHVHFPYVDVKELEAVLSSA
jgi:5'-3' exonuclease